MKGYVEKMISEYPDMVKRREVVKRQLLSLKNTQVSIDDIIEVMTFSHPDGERVQTSSISDKVARIAMNYKDYQEKMNAEAFEYWMGRYEHLNREIVFFEDSIKGLPDELSEIMQALIINNQSWEDVEQGFCISHMTLQRMRKSAIEDLVRTYQKRESELSSFLLS